MGQSIVVTEKPSSNPGVVRFETNRALTGMGHERYLAGTEVWGDRPPDELARRLFTQPSVAGVQVNSNIITVDIAKGYTSEGLLEVIENLYRFYPDAPASGEAGPELSEEDAAPESQADPEPAAPVDPPAADAAPAPEPEPAVDAEPEAAAEAPSTEAEVSAPEPETPAPEAPAAEAPADDVDEAPAPEAPAAEAPADDVDEAPAPEIPAFAVDEPAPAGEPAPADESAAADEPTDA